MACSDIISSFSPNADLFAIVSSDGCLKIWETSSNILKQEYTPSSHLSSACSALAWGPCQQSTVLQKKRAKKNEVSVAVGDLNLIAMGTLSGEVLLYSVAKGDLHMQLTGGHTEGVNGISWFAEEDSLFTCSNDHHIVKWSITQGLVSVKWKASKTAVHAVCVIDNSSLLYASSAIFWWDIKKEVVLKKFTGHATEVFCLLPVIVGESTNANYFISAATGDRVLSVWQLTKDNNSNSIASFTMSDEPATLGIPESHVKSQPLVLSVVTKSGILNIFEHQLNGRVKKPLSPKSSVQIASMANKSEKKSQRIPFLGAKLNEGNCMVAYGNFLKPIFERMELECFQKETYLIRENHVSSSVSLEGISKIKQPEIPNNVKVLAPGYMTPSKSTDSISRKKKRKEELDQELPMEQRLNAIYLGQAPENDRVPDVAPNSDSMVHLLLQGLQSEDNKLLNTVFRCNDKTLIQNTVKRLPVNSIEKLIPLLQQRISKGQESSRSCLTWLKNLIGVNLSYFGTIEDVDEYIGSVSQLFESCEEHLVKMSHLTGFIDILISQIECTSESNSHLSTEPQVAYEVESSGEEIDDEMDHSDIQSDVESHLESSSESDYDDELPIPSNDEMENL